MAARQSRNNKVNPAGILSGLSDLRKDVRLSLCLAVSEGPELHKSHTDRFIQGKAILRRCKTKRRHPPKKNTIKKVSTKSRLDSAASVEEPSRHLCVIVFQELDSPLTHLHSLPQHPSNGLRVGKPAIQAAVANGNTVLPDSDDHVSESPTATAAPLFFWFFSFLSMHKLLNSLKLLFQ